MNFLKSLFHRKENSGNKKAEALRAQMERVLKRPVPMLLTETVFNATSDEALFQVVFHTLTFKKIRTGKDEFEVITSWNKYRQAAYVIWVLLGEVNNGGFNQYYFNTGGRYASLLPEALKLTGAHSHAAIMESANSVFLKGNEKITEMQDVSLEGFSKSYEDNPLNGLDKKFYDLNKKESLYTIVVKFIRANRTDFIDP